MTLSRRHYIVYFVCFARLTAKALPSGSISSLPAKFRVCFGKVLPLIARLSELAPSGAKVEGLIQAARCRTRCLIELLAPAFGGLYGPGGLVSPVIILPPNLRRAVTGARTVSTLPVPSGRFRTHFLPTAVKHSCQDVFYFFLTDDFLFLQSTFSDTLLNRPNKPPSTRDSRATSCRGSLSRRSDPRPRSIHTACP